MCDADTCLLDILSFICAWLLFFAFTSPYHQRSIGECVEQKATFGVIKTMEAFCIFCDYLPHRPRSSVFQFPSHLSLSSLAALRISSFLSLSCSCSLTPPKRLMRYGLLFSPLTQAHWRSPPHLPIQNQSEAPAFNIIFK